MSEPRMLDLGHPAPVGQPIEEHPAMVISTGQMTTSQRKAPSDGNYFLNGGKFFVRKGDPYPDGVEFVPKAGAAKEEDATAEDAPKPAKASKRGPTETTDAAGPSETT